PQHSSLYVSPELGQELGGIGRDDPIAAYFATRAAAMGAVGAETVTATFYNFNHALVARHVPAVWDIASPARVLDARLRAADATQRRLLG
ncbi:helix-turn-helix domain-containing protein, partial [Streptomyces sp. DT225]